MNTRINQKQMKFVVFDNESYTEIHHCLLVDCDGLSQSIEIWFDAQTHALRHGDLAAAFIAPSISNTRSGRPKVVTSRNFP